VNGQREDNNNYLIEGISATDYNVAQSTNSPCPTPMSSRNSKVQTSLYDASQGRNGGGKRQRVLKSVREKFMASLRVFPQRRSQRQRVFFLNARPARSALR